MTLSSQQEHLELIALNDAIASFSRLFANTVRYHHWHQCLEILYVEEGFGVAIVDNRHYTMRPGRLFFFPPFTRHKVMVDPQAEANYRDVFENALVGIFRADPQGRLRLANPAAARILGQASAGRAMQEIGNLGDLSVRALETLRSADFIAAEDTRVTAKLLNHFEIKKPCVSYYEHNKYASGEKIVARLLAGETCALVTDAGMPAISDPGEDIVRQCAEQGIDVQVIPGPCAAIAALAVSASWPTS